jgi:hypothetical protein
MPRTKRSHHHIYHDTGQGTGANPAGELIRAVIATPGLSPGLTGALDILSEQSRLQPPRPLDVIQCGALPELVTALQQDYGLGADSSIADDRHYLAAKQRAMKLRLLTQFCSLLLPDLKSSQVVELLDFLCRLLGRAASDGETAATNIKVTLRAEEKHLVLALLSVFLNRCADKVGERLGELLGYLAVLAAIHGSGQEGVSLIPTNLPHLHFTPTAAPPADNSRRSESSSSCPETSESDFSDSDMALGDSDYRQPAGSGIVERTALVCLNTIVKKCPKKDVVSFWFVFLPDRCFCPLNAGVADLLSHPSKRIRQLAASILVGRGIEERIE